MRFIGTIEAKTDAKGRAFLPAQFRKMLQSSSEDVVVLRRDVFQPCLVLYPESVWNAQMDLLRSRLNRWNPQHQQIFRQFVSDAESITLDTSGRILLPRRYVKDLHLEQDIRFVGMGDSIEIWNNAQQSEQMLDAETFGRALETLMAPVASIQNPTSDN